MSDNSIKEVPHFWIINRLEMGYFHSVDFNKIANLFFDDGFKIYAAKPNSHLIIWHRDVSVMTLFLLKYNEVVRDYSLKIKPYYHNVKGEVYV